MSDAIRGGDDLLTALRSGRIEGRRERLRATTQLLEGTFYQEMFKVMRASVPEGGALSGGTGQEMFESLLDQRIADAAAVRSEDGLGSALYRHFTRVLGEPSEGGEVAAPGPEGE